jgi:linoleoyl-CoA desaturase
MLKKPHFESDHPDQSLFWKILRKKVNNYFDSNNISPKANTEMVVKTIVILLAYIVPLCCIFLLPESVTMALVLVIIIGFAKAGIGMSVMHDALHGAYSSKKWVNKLVGSSMYLIGSNVFNWKIQHNIYHHAYTNIDGLDEDIQTRWIIRLCDFKPLKPIHGFQHIYAFVLYGLMTFSMLISDVTQLISYNKKGLTQKHGGNPPNEVVKMLAVKFIYLFIMIALPLLITEYRWWQVLIGFAIMHWVAGFILSLVFQLAHIVEGAHQHESNIETFIPNEWAVHQLLTTANFAPTNKILNWYVGGLNFQVEHHLFPHICHVHYSKISPLVAQTAAAFGIPYNTKPTFRKAVKSHVKRMRELGNGKVANYTNVIDKEHNPD